MQFLSYSNTCILHIDYLKIDKLYFTYKLLLLLYTNHAVHSIYSLYYEDFSIEEAFQYFFVIFALKGQSINKPSLLVFWLLIL